jgi:predicted TPR repeat methyltransferase
MKKPLTAPLQQALRAAQTQHQQGEFDAARRGYRRLLKHHPGLIPALHYLGVLEHMDNHSEKGLSLIQQALARAPDDYDIRRNMANVLNDINRAQEAEPVYRELIQERPKDPGNHSNLSAALRKLGRFAEAVEAAREATRLAPDLPVTWHALGNALASIQQLEEAAEAYEKVLTLAPEFSPAHNSLCQVLLKIERGGWLSRRRLRRTRAAYQRWLKASPGHPTASFMLEALERGVAPERMPDSAVRATFDAYAEDFDVHLRSLEYRAPELVAEVLKRRLDAPESTLDILDCGCGTGLSAPLLKPWARQLWGIDLSSGMLQQARRTGLYDSLYEAEAGLFLVDHPEQFDLCVFIDVLSYFGDLESIMKKAARALRPNGWLALTVERSPSSGFQLHPTGRYSHHEDHVRSAMRTAGMADIEVEVAAIRNEGQAPVRGLIVSARKKR